MTIACNYVLGRRLKKAALTPIALEFKGETLSDNVYHCRYDCGYYGSLSRRSIQTRMERGSVDCPACARARSYITRAERHLERKAAAARRAAVPVILAGGRDKQWPGSLPGYNGRNVPWYDRAHLDFPGE